MAQEIYIISDDDILMRNLTYIFKDEDYILKAVKPNEIDIALKEIPSIIIIDDDVIKENIEDVCLQVRSDEDNKITPILFITSNKDKERKKRIIRHQVQFYLEKPFDNEEVYYTIKNIIDLMYLNRRISPLTGLPGNVQIQAELKKRLLKKSDFAVMYLDLDNFKAYNDKYGFLKGDEIIKFTAKIIVKHVHEVAEDVFVGHIGGDDFIAIVPNNVYEKVSQDIILDFDRNILEFFTPEDAMQGFIEVPNRRGIIEEVPLTSISIGIVEVDSNNFSNILEIAEVGAQVKHMAKVTLGSAYAINKRKIIEN